MAASLPVFHKRQSLAAAEFCTSDFCGSVFWQKAAVCASLLPSVGERSLCWCDRRVTPVGLMWG
jgi:hypothetical protein